MKVHSTGNGDETSICPRAVTVDEAINEVGVGRAQIMMLFICGLSFCADAAEVTFLSFVTEVLRCEWHLTAGQEALVTSAVFVGQTIASPFWGIIADTKGRRPAFLFSSGLIAVCGVAAGFSQNYEMFLGSSFLVGIGIAGLPVGFDILVEAVPSKNRGPFTLSIQLFWTFGSMYVNCCAWLLLQSAGWRVFAMVAAIPVTVSCVAAYFILPESPRWLHEEGRPEEALVILNEWSKQNGSNKGFGALQTHLKEKSVSTCDLCTNSHLRCKTMLMMVVWLAWGLVYYSIVLLLPRIAGKESTAKSGGGCQSSFDFGDLASSASTEVFGVAAAFMMIENPGRKGTQGFFYFIAGVSAYMVSFRALDMRLLVLIATVCRISTFAACTGTWVHTPELYPTSIRIQAHGMINIAARVGASVAPFLISDLLTPTQCGSIMAGVCFAAVLAVTGLPETAGVDLEEAEGGTEEGTSLASTLRIELPKAA